MDRPKMIASIRIGMVGSIDPVGVNRSKPDRCPHWKIQTTTPNVADSDSTFITIAFSGSTTEPNARNSSTKREAKSQPPPPVQGPSPCLEHLASRLEML